MPLISIGLDSLRMVASKRFHGIHQPRAAHQTNPSPNWRRYDPTGPHGQTHSKAPTAIRPDRRIRFLGYPLDVLTEDETIAEVHRIVETRTPVQHCVLNAFKVHLLGHNKAFTDVLEKCALVQADGVSVVWADISWGFPSIRESPESI